MRTRSSSIVTATLLVALGCAHASATAPSPPTPPPAPRAAAGFGGAERGASSVDAAPKTPGVPDRRETITAEELASIPDPVPASESTEIGGRGPAAAAPTDSVRSDAGREPGPAAAPTSGSNRVTVSRAAAGDERGWIWRVQIFASPDLAQADRIAKEASARFGEPSVIEFEGALYKVRLGAFTSEGLAQALREKAIQGGFPGAFRMRSTSQ